jgi:hypothetical protein
MQATLNQDIVEFEFEELVTKSMGDLSMAISCTGCSRCNAGGCNGCKGCGHDDRQQQL